MSAFNYEHIELYLSGKMTEEEKTAFENVLAQNDTLKEEVNLYKNIDASMRHLSTEQSQTDALQNQLSALNHIYFNKATPKTEASVVVMPKRSAKRWLSIAAMLTVLLSVYFLVRSPQETLPELAHHYVNTELKNLSVTMGAKEDSLQIALDFYNEKAYPEAENFFREIHDRDPGNTYALKFRGISLLKMEQYDEALKVFNELASNTELYSNPGTFLKAVTLLNRQLAGDEAQARRLLKNVVANNLEGEKQAAKWLAN